MNRRLLWVAVAAFVVLFVGSRIVSSARGPELPAYEVVSQPLVQTVVATGRVAAFSRIQVGSEVTGVVIERRVQEGDAVSPGDVLAVLRADDLEAALREAEAALATLEKATRPQAEAALREAEAALTQAAREVERRRDLLQRQLVSREAMEQATQAEVRAKAAADRARLAFNALGKGSPDEVAAQARVASAQARLDKTTIRSEVAGTVLSRNAEPGDVVQPTRVLFEIARTGATELLVPLDEKNIEVLALDQSAMCVADAFPSRPFPATVSFIAPSVDPARGTVDVRLTVAPEHDFLREGMTVSVNVETGRRDAALTVPNDALLRIDGNQAFVWAIVDGKATQRQVQLGLRGLIQTEVLSGVESNAWVLATAPQDLQEGDAVRVVPTPTPTGERAASTSNELPVQLD